MPHPYPRPGFRRLSYLYKFMVLVPYLEVSHKLNTSHTYQEILIKLTSFHDLIAIPCNLRLHFYFYDHITDDVM